MNNLILAVLAAVFFLFLIIFRNVSEIKRYANRKPIPCWVILALTGFITAIPLLVAIFCVCAIYRQGVKLILKIKHGSKFAGLLQGADAFHAVDEPSLTVIHFLLMIQCSTKDSPDEAFESIRKMILKLNQHSKFKMTFHSLLGYSYMLKGELTVDDCISKMKTIHCQNNKIEKTELLRLLNECCNAPLPRNGLLPWQVLIGTQSVKWREDDTDYYPVLFRIHHAVADGVTLAKVITGSLTDKQFAKKVSLDKVAGRRHSESNSDNSNTSNASYTMSKEMQYIFIEYFNRITISLFNQARKLMMGFYVIFLIPASFVVNFLLKANDCNILHGPRLTGQKVLAWNTEESCGYVKKIKKIKSKVPGTSFPDVLLTACSASLADHLKKHSACLPKCITGAIPILSGSSEISHLVPGEFDVNSVTVGNSYSLLLMNLPVANENKQQVMKDTPLIDKLKLIKEESDILKNSVDYMVNYFIMSVACSVIPQCIIKMVLSRMRCSIAFTALPGPSKFALKEGSMILSDVESWAPHLYNISTILSINTYDGRLHIGLSVDKAVIADQNDAQKIVDDIYKYLDLLERETDSLYLKNK